MSRMIAARAWVARSVEAWLVVPAMTAARARPPELALEVAQAVKGAARREAVARTLVDPNEAVAAIVLYREAAILLIGAIAASRGIACERTPSAAWGRLD